jgi:hypothetical protein
MTEMTEKQLQHVKEMWDAAQQIGMEIAEMPREKREAAFVRAETALRQAWAARKLPERGKEEYIKLQMDALRSAVRSIDLGGSPKGGKA